MKPTDEPFGPINRSQPKFWCHPNPGIHETKTREEILTEMERLWIEMERNNSMPYMIQIKSKPWYHATWAWIRRAAGAPVRGMKWLLGEDQ
jgi:acyl-ACP thioesterase